MINLEDLLEGYYLKIKPPRGNKIFYFNLENNIVFNNSLELLQPHSKEGRLFKKYLKKSFLFFKIIKKVGLIKKKKGNEIFINSIHKQINFEGNQMSFYKSEDSDKIVIQIISNEFVKGYIKFPLNQKGVEKLKQEIQNYRFIKNKDVTPKFFYCKFNSIPLLFVEKLIPLRIDHFDLKSFLKKLKSSEKYKLVDHPRQKEIKRKFFDATNNQNLINMLDLRLSKNSNKFCVVFEHGDFTPWNLFQNENREVKIIDLEYSNPLGLEFIDEIRYYYSEEKLVQKKNEVNLYKLIQSKFDGIEDFNLVYILFLMEEYVKTSDLNVLILISSMLNEEK